MEKQQLTQDLADELIPNVLQGWRYFMAAELEDADDDGIDPVQVCDEFCEENSTKILADVYKAGKHDYETLQTILNDQRLMYQSYVQVLENLMVANDMINGYDED